MKENPNYVRGKWEGNNYKYCAKGKREIQCENYNSYVEIKK